MSNTPNYSINYEDEKFKQVETQRDQALTEVDQQYDEMIGNTDKYYQDLINQSKENADKMAEVQNQNKDFAIEKIEQQRDNYQKDYQKEQSGAYVDWQKQSNQYGVTAEQMAMQGMTGTGYSESSQVSMYTAYQNRVATAREVLAQANMNCDNGIKEAILQNNSALAEIYANANKEQLEIALQGFQYKNTLLENQMEREMQLKQYYSNEWQNVLNQMNTENALAEEVRQANIQQEQWQKEYDRKVAEFNEQMAYQKEQDERNYQLQQAQLAESKRQFETSYNLTVDLVTNSAYWNGERAKNVGGYGYFSNGYQPKGIEIDGQSYKLQAAKDKDGKTVKFNKTNTTLWGSEETKEITVWTANGQYFYWNGPTNKYIEMTKSEAKKLGVKV